MKMFVSRVRVEGRELVYSTNAEKRLDTEIVLASIRQLSTDFNGKLAIDDKLAQYTS